MASDTTRSERSSYPMLSLADGAAQQLQDALLLFGRVMLGWIFMQSGWAKVMNIHGFAAGMPRLGLPEIMGYMGAPVEFLGGLAIVLGLGTRYAALAIFAFTIVATLTSHTFWHYAPGPEYRQQATQFWKNVSILGGLVLLFAAGPGRASVDWLLRKRNA